MTITKAGTVIDGMIIKGTLTILAENVVIKNSQITYTGWWGIDGEKAKNLIVQDNDIIGPGYSASSNAGIVGSGTFLRNDISKSENGIVLQGGASTVKGNYIHDLQAAGSDPHYDGISVQGGQNGVLIEGNTIEGRDTSDIFIKNDFGPISNVTVKGNYLIGEPAYMIYVDGRASGGAITNIQISGNYLEKGLYGLYSVDKSSPVITGNVVLNDGQLPPAISSPSSPTVPVPTEPTKPTVPSTPTSPSVPDTSGSTGGGSHSDGGGSSSKPNYLKGSYGNDALTGTAGADVMRGMRGNDTYTVNHAGDKVIEDGHRSGGVDTVKSSISFSLSGPNVSGAVEHLTLTGNAHINGTGNYLSNTIIGNSGNNTLNGLHGNDTLRGGAGKDTFVFNTLPNAKTNVDKITDFNVRDDTVALDNSIFKAVGADGWLAASAFHTGTAAHDANDRVIYNPNTGALIYDYNGNAAGGSVQFATLSPNLSLTHADFQII